MAGKIWIQEDQGGWSSGLGGTLAAAVLAVFAVAPGAQALDFDVLLYDDGSGNVRAGGIDTDTLTPELGHAVLEGGLLGDTTLPNPSFQADEPGIFSVSDDNAGLLGGSNDNLPGGAAVTLDFLVEPTLNISLAYWDGAQFGATPLGETLSVAVGANLYGGLGGSNQLLGVDLGSTASDGGLHVHPDWDLGVATPGVYLAYGHANVAGLNGPSNPFWLVFGTLDACAASADCTPLQELFNAGIEDQITAGIAYVNANLVPIPEPSTALLMALGLAGLNASRRR